MEKMNLAIFDIDGTLTETNDVDTVCFVQAFADTHAITGINTNWAEYSHTTDSGISFQLFKERFGRVPDEDELVKLKNRFVNLLEEQSAKDSSLFAEIVGASSILTRLSQESEWKVAIASGSWRECAALKLKVANIETSEFPAAFAEDGFSREEILQTAVSKAQQAYFQSSFDKIVSIGDGLWDVRAAFNLKFPFLGVGKGERKRILRQAGAMQIVGDFTDYSQFISCLKETEVPKIEEVL